MNKRKQNRKEKTLFGKFLKHTSNGTCKNDEEDNS